jgi:hypothetical protein
MFISWESKIVGFEGFGALGFSLRSLRREDSSTGQKELLVPFGQSLF